MYRKKPPLSPDVYPAKMSWQNDPWRRSVFLPLLILSLLFMLTTGSGFDQQLAGWFYHLEGEQWLLQHYWLTESVLHQGVRQLNQLVVLFLLCYWLTQFVVGHKNAALGVLLISLIVSFGSIALLKKLIPMECPWDLQQFGGSQAFIGLFNSRPTMMAPTQCFPAGHASIGYGWMAIYYFYQVTSPSKARLALIFSISLGLVLGFTQQLRGAHFLSHDIATAAICWLVASCTFRWFYPQLAVSRLHSGPKPGEPSTTLANHSQNPESADA